MKCDNCFTKINKEDAFCPNCGIRLPKQEPPATSPQQPTYTSPQNAGQYQMPPQGFAAPQGQTTQPRQPNAFYAPPQNPPSSYNVPPQGTQYGYIPPYPAEQPQNKPKTSVLALGIIGIVFALLFPLVTYGCSIPGLVMANKEIRLGQTTSKTGQILNIVALCVAGLNSILGILYF